MKNYDQNKELSYIQYLDANNLYGWAMSQKLLVDGLKWKKCISKFNEDFIKNYDEENDEGYMLEVDVVNILKIYIICILICHFYQKE